MIPWLRRWGLVVLVALMIGYALLSTWGRDCHYNATVRKLLCSEERTEPRPAPAPPPGVL